MKKGCGRADGYRLMRKPELWIAVIAVAVVAIGNTLPELSQMVQKEFLTVDKIIDNITTVGGWYRNLIFMIAAIPFAGSYCKDTEHHFREGMLWRAKGESYIWSKILWNGAASFFATFVGLFIAVVMFSFFQKFYYYDVGPQGDYFGIYTEILEAGHPFCFIFIRIVIFSIGSMFWSTAALTVSAWKQDILVVYATPFLASYILARIQNVMPEFINIDFCIAGRELIPYSWLSNLLYGIFFLMFLTLVFGNIFAWKVKRSVNGGKY